MSHNNSGSSGSILMKLFPVDMPQGRGDNARTIFWKARKKMVNFGPQTTELKWLILTNPSVNFSGDYISAIRGCCH